MPRNHVRVIIMVDEEGGEEAKYTRSTSLGGVANVVSDGAELARIIQRYVQGCDFVAWHLEHPTNGAIRPEEPKNAAAL